MQDTKIKTLKSRHQNEDSTMTLNFKATYIKAIRERYFNSSKKEKSMILDELCTITGYNRKWVIRILAKDHKTGKKTSGRSRLRSNT